MQRYTIVFVLAAITGVHGSFVCHNAQFLNGDRCKTCPLGTSTPSGFFVLQTEHATIHTENYTQIDNIPRAWNTRNFATMFTDGLDFTLNTTQIPHARVSFIALNASADASVMLKTSDSSAQSEILYYTHAYDRVANRSENITGFSQHLEFDARYEKIEVRALTSGGVWMQWRKPLQNATECVPCERGFYRNETDQRSCLPCEPRTVWVDADSSCDFCSNNSNSAKEWASTTCVSCDAHRRYENDLQDYVPGCPWCPKDYESKESNASCILCPEGYGRAQHNTDGCRGLYPNQGLCPTYGLNDAQTKYTMILDEDAYTNCSCSPTRILQYVPTHDESTENCSEHAGWKGVQRHLDNSICSVRTCVFQRECTIFETSWKDIHLTKADLLINMPNSPAYRPHYNVSHFATNCTLSICTEPIRVIDTSPIQHSRLVCTGFELPHLEQVQENTLPNCERRCYSLGSNCSYYQYNHFSDDCFIDTKSSTQYNLDTVNCSQPDNGVNFFYYYDSVPGPVELIPDNDFSLFYMNSPKTPRVYLRRDQIFNVELGNISHIISIRNQYEINSVLDTCEKLCISIQDCNYFKLKKMDDFFGTQCYLSASVTRVDESPVVEENVYHMHADTSMICTSDIQDRIYHSTDKVFSCLSHEILNLETHECQPCPVNHVPLDDPKCYTVEIFAACQNCKECAPGSNANIRDANCKVCASSQRRTSIDTLNCTECPLNHIQSTLSEFRCDPCPFAHNVSMRDGFDVCVPCGTGYAGDPVLYPQPGCIKCPASFKQIHTESCNCPPGYSQNGLTCVPCAAGFYSEDYATPKCLPCPPGTIAPHMQSRRCIPCALDRGEKYTSPTSCLPMSCSNADVSGFCVETTSMLPNCSAGYEAVQLEREEWACLPCARGWFKPNTGTSTCVQCSKKQYSLPGAQYCTTNTQCNTENTIASASIQQTLDLFSQVPSLVPLRQLMAPCTLSPYAAVDPDSCACRRGFYYNADTRSCVVCPKPLTSTALNATQCVRCASGSVWQYGGPCTQCPVGKLPNTNQTACIACPANQTTPFPGSSECVCEAGRHAVGDQCELCPTHQIKTRPGNESWLCNACVPDEISNPEHTECVQCKRNTQRVLDSDRCACGKAYYDVGNRCIACSPGTSTTQYGATTCKSCMPGEFSASYATPCTACAIGKFADMAGLSTCSSCAIGTYDLYHGVEEPGQNRSSCIRCSENKSTISDGSHNLEACMCEPGKEMIADVCRACPAGKFKPDTGNHTCEPCPNGTIASTPGQKQCTSCLCNQIYVNGIECRDCPEYRVQYRTQDNQCAFCDCGSYVDHRFGANIHTTTDQGKCCNNAVGGVSAETCQNQNCMGELPCCVGWGLENRVCTRCAAGYYKNVAGNSPCTACEAGKYSDTNTATVCDVCPHATYPLINATTCLSCSINISSQTIVDTCCVGWGYNGSHCTACAAGYFKNESNLDTCTACEAGKYANVTGATTCKACLAGSYSVHNGSTVCEKCTSNQVTLGEGKTACFYCPAGKFKGTCTDSDLKNASCMDDDICTQCKQGSSTDSELKRTHPTDCTTVCYDVEWQETFECQQCPPGKYTRRYATVSDGLGCVDCETGKYQPDPGKLACLNCEYICGQQSLGYKKLCGGAYEGNGENVWVPGESCELVNQICCNGMECMEKDNQFICDLFY